MEVMLPRAKLREKHTTEPICCHPSPKCTFNGRYYKPSLSPFHCLCEGQRENWVTIQDQGVTTKHQLGAGVKRSQEHHRGKAAVHVPELFVSTVMFHKSVSRFFPSNTSNAQVMFHIRWPLNVSSLSSYKQQTKGDMRGCPESTWQFDHHLTTE